ncbi:MAG: hypothetical protein QM682_14520 [Paracoccus sp. (in: a-proteobacteria)]|uniref:hypothetical protein n=1 Tax=Paracoccus sp. TaxID=267 RepID=UPI0039E29C81
MITKIDTTTIPALDPWGSVTNLGSEVLEGDVQCMGSMIHGAPTDPVSCAFFGVTLTDESTGIATSYGVGDAWFVEKGTAILWEVTSDRFVKNYFAVA